MCLCLYWYTIYYYPIQVLYTLLEDHSVYILGVDAKIISILVLNTYHIINISISHLL